MQIGRALGLRAIGVSLLVYALGRLARGGVAALDLVPQISRLPITPANRVGVDFRGHADRGVAQALRYGRKVHAVGGLMRPSRVDRPFGRAQGVGKARNLCRHIQVQPEWTAELHNCADCLFLCI